MASARQIDIGPIDEVVTDEDENFCGDEALTVEFVTTGSAGSMWSRTAATSFRIRSQLQVHDVVTHLDNGNSVTSTATVRDKDQRVTDNGDGRSRSLSSLPAMRCIRAGRQGDREEPGQVRFEILINNNGTPTNPEDDSSEFSET